MTAPGLTATRSDRPRAARSATPTGFHLRRRAHKVALTAHILTSVGWFGIAVILAWCGLVGSTTGDAQLADGLFRLMETAPWLSIPVGLLAIATGVLLSLGTTYGLVRYWWVVAKIAIAVAVVITDAVIISVAAHHAVITGEVQAPLVHGTIAHVVVLAIATVLSVFKPRARTPWGWNR